jgi:hypothetical protein
MTISDRKMAVIFKKDAADYIRAVFRTAVRRRQYQAGGADILHALARDRAASESMSVGEWLDREGVYLRH